MWLEFRRVLFRSVNTSERENFIFKSKKWANRTSVGKLNNCESILSSTPPWPGNKELVSLSSIDRLIFDSNKSPKVPNKTNKIEIKIFSVKVTVKK